MTAAHGLGWPGQPGQEGDASGEEVPPRAEPAERAEPAGRDPASAATAPGWQAARGQWPRDPRPGGQPGDAAAPPGPDGLGWPPAAPPAGMETARPGSAAPEAAGFGVTDLSRGGGESDVVIPVVPEPASDTPIARAARAALAARSGSPAWPRPTSCRIITIANQKGGVGKTTTAVNLAASLSLHGSRVLVIDLDPQGNASTALDVDHRSGTVSVYNVLVDGQPLSGVVRPVAGIPQLYCAPATIDLAGAEIELVPLVARESRLVRALAGFDSTGLDYIFIDCPPSLGLLTVNALVAAPEVLIPIQCEYYALEGLEQLLRTVDLVKSHLNPGLAVSTILLTMYDARTRLASQVAEEVRGHFGEIVLRSIIPRSVRVSEAPSYGQSVITYDPGSSGAQAYLEAAREMADRNTARA
jgi:chromosome partitioning protein